MKNLPNPIIFLKNHLMQNPSMRKLHEYGILLFVFSLPIFEAPKNMGFCMMLTGFLGISFYKRPIKLEKPDFIEGLLIAILTASAISTFLNWPLLEGLKGLKHVFYQIITFWMLYRSRYDKTFLIQVSIALVAGTLVGIFWAEYHLFSSHIPFSVNGDLTIQFNSINSVTRSGAFGATILLVCAGTLVDNDCRFNRIHIYFFTIAWVIISAFILIMGGRGNVLGALGAYLLLLIPLLKHKKYQYFIAIQTAIALVAFIVLYVHPGTIQAGRFKNLLYTKFTTDINDMGLNDRMRYDYWRIGVAQISQHPSLFGVGPRNFKSITVKDLHLDPPLLPETLKLIDKAPRHSHNWILTKWAEDGLVGILLFSGLILTLLFTLWKQRPGNGKNDVTWIWVASFSAIIIAVISGLFNSAFTHENGWLTFFLMGLGANYAKQKPRIKKRSC